MSGADNLEPSDQREPAENGSITVALSVFHSLCFYDNDFISEWLIKTRVIKVRETDGLQHKPVVT
jgi:hypothetical protein